MRVKFLTQGNNGSLNLMELELTTDQLQVRLPTRCVVLYFKRMLVQHEFYFDPCN